MRNFTEKMRENILAVGILNAWVSRQMRETWHVCMTASPDFTQVDPRTRDRP